MKAFATFIQRPVSQRCLLTIIPLPRQKRVSRTRWFRIFPARWEETTWRALPAADQQVTSQR